MGRSNNSTKSGHRSFVTGCASNAIPANLPAGPEAIRHPVGWMIRLDDVEQDHQRERERCLARGE